jgi:parvulin-like peptidyl-prolyl isomerase
MKTLYLPALFAILACAQTAPAPRAEPAADAVIATIDGKPLTYGELHSYISTLSQAQARTALDNLENTIRQYAMLTRLSKLGEDQKLDQKQPYIDILRAGRMQVMAQAAISDQYQKVLVLPNEQEAYYKEHQAQYSKLKVKTIYLAFASNPTAAPATGKKYRSEKDAEALANDLVKKLRGGGDFVGMVKQYSDDEQSKAANGDWATVSAADNLPDDFKRAVLALKVGEITEPLHRSGGFYIFKADSMVERPYSEVRDEIYNLLKEVKMRKWMDTMQQSIPIKIEPAANPGKPNNPPAGQ